MPVSSNMEILQILLQKWKFNWWKTVLQADFEEKPFVKIYY
jgi:hypothetical protein